MGGRGASSHSSSYSNSMTGDKEYDKVVADLIKKYKDIKPTNVIAINGAERFLKDHPNGFEGFIENKAKLLINNHKANQKLVANHEKTMARLERSIKAEEAELKKMKRNTVSMLNVRGERVKTDSLGVEKQTKKLVMLNKSLRMHEAEYSAKKSAIKNFDKHFKEQMDIHVKRVKRAENHKKKK